MEQYLLLAAGVLGIPLVYAGAMAWYSPAFEKEETGPLQNREIYGAAAPFLCPKNRKRTPKSP